MVLWFVNIFPQPNLPLTKYSNIVGPWQMFVEFEAEMIRVLTANLSKSRTSPGVEMTILNPKV